MTGGWARTRGGGSGTRGGWAGTSLGGSGTRGGRGGDKRRRGEKDVEKLEKLSTKLMNAHYHKDLHHRRF